MGRTALVAGARFLIACAVLGGVLTLARPLLYPVVARVARDFSVLTTPPGLVAEVAWQESHTRFRLISQALREAIHLESVSLLLILVLPASFAFALPAPRRWRASALVLLGCLVVGSLIVGQDLVAFLSHTMEEQGISIFPPTLSAFHEGWIGLGWDFSMIGVPATACILALWPLLESGPTSSVGDAASSREPAPAAARKRLLVSAAAGAAAVATLIGLDQLASTRAADAKARRSFLIELSSREPELADHFLSRGEAALADTRIRDAKAYFKRAALFPATRARARDGTRRVSALHPKGKTGK